MMDDAICFNKKFHEFQHFIFIQYPVVAVVEVYKQLVHLMYLQINIYIHIYIRIDVHIFVCIIRESQPHHAY